MMVRAGTVKTDQELALIRTIAVAARPLEEDLKWSRLQIIDRLQKTRERFKEQWVGASPCLVLKDGWILPDGPVEKMLSAMDKHGEPVGMVGIAWLTQAKRVAVLQMLFRNKADKNAQAVMKRAADSALERWNEYVRQLNPLKPSDGKE